MKGIIFDICSKILHATTMKHILWITCFGAFLTLISCSGDDEPLLQQKKENFYINLTWDDSLYSITNDTYQLDSSGATFACAGNYTNGQRSTENYIYKKQPLSLNAPQDTNFITAVYFDISKKVFEDELNSEDEFSYMKEMLSADQFGFPVNSSGYYKVYDPENVEFIVEKGVSAEVYLDISNRGKFYRSSSVVPNERANESFFKLDNFTTVEDSTVKDYQYIIEGSFSVNLFGGDDETESKTITGTLRWPVKAIKNSKLLSLCE